MRDIKAFTEKAGLNIDETIRSIALWMYQSVKAKSPVDTGLFRANWQIGIDNYPVAVYSSIDGRDDQEIVKLRNFKKGMTIWINNNLPYARRLEYGWSQRQAPLGMVRLTIMEAKSHLAQTMRAT